MCIHDCLRARITGAASGIGFGIAEKCAREGMKVVLADIEVSALESAESKLKAIGAETLAVPSARSNPIISICLPIGNVSF